MRTGHFEVSFALAVGDGRGERRLPRAPPAPRCPSPANIAAHRRTARHHAVPDATAPLTTTVARGHRHAVLDAAASRRVTFTRRRAAIVRRCAVFGSDAEFVELFDLSGPEPGPHGRPGLPLRPGADVLSAGDVPGRQFVETAAT
ncbi:hypothetical protein [Embleya sp. NPDC059237]|uniref:hypothetical protein n=1 Tax=Embleya sp. NPDC059237 TaxID=3346784 RepID=UPI0036A397FD